MAARPTNWLSFSLLSPMEMLRSNHSNNDDDDSQFLQYDAASATSHSHYFLDNFYASNNGVNHYILNHSFHFTPNLFMLLLLFSVCCKNPKSPKF